MLILLLAKNLRRRGFNSKGVESSGFACSGEERFQECGLRKARKKCSFQGYGPQFVHSLLPRPIFWHGFCSHIGFCPPYSAFETRLLPENLLPGNFSCPTFGSNLFPRKAMLTGKPVGIGLLLLFKHSKKANLSLLVKPGE